MVTRLRSLLRFLHVEGLTERALAAAVPAVASWRLASLPKAIDARAVARLLGSCDRRTSVGRRDFAILTLLSRLGLRAGEVAAAELRDIDWRQGELVVRGKGNREERLPLPADVGAAVVGWLRRGRPRCACPYVFTRLRQRAEQLIRSFGPYVFRVTLIEVCPSCAWRSFGCAPAATISAACVCRRSWKRSGARTAGRKTRDMKLSLRQTTPPGVGKTSPGRRRNSRA
jgi:integrase